MQDDEKFLTKLDSLEDRLRTEFEEKMKDLEQQLLDLKESTKKTDDGQQEQLDGLKLIQINHTSIIEELQSGVKVLKNEKCQQENFDHEIYKIQEMIAKLSNGEKVEVVAAKPQSAGGVRVSDEDIQRWNDSARLSKVHESTIDKLKTQMEVIDPLSENVKEVQRKLLICIFKEEFNVAIHNI